MAETKFRLKTQIFHQISSEYVIYMPSNIAEKLGERNILDILLTLKKTCSLKLEQFSGF